MMKELIGQNKVVHIYSLFENISPYSYTTADYIISQAENLNAEKTEHLLCNGFLFHDRKLRVEINIKDTEIFSKRLEGKTAYFDIRTSRDVSEEMYVLACKAFNNDRRFHLEQNFDQNLANQIIKAYFNDFNQRDILIFKALQNKELLGFIIVEKHSDGKCENLLGATRPDIKGKIIAYGLYVNVLKMLAENEYGNLKKYYGDVSSTNLASLNLHIQLGARIKKIYDEFIYRNVQILGGGLD